MRNPEPVPATAPCEQPSGPRRRSPAGSIRESSARDATAAASPPSARRRPRRAL